MIIQPDALEKRLKGAKNINQLHLVNLLCVKNLVMLLGYDDTNNPYLNKELPIDVQEIYKNIYIMYTSCYSPIVYQATAMLLDLYWPFWRKYVDSAVLGRVVSRGDKEVVKWTKDVLNRDNSTCRDCGSNKNLQVHHILPWASSIESRVNIDNGITLCNHCHGLQHGYLYNLIVSKTQNDRSKKEVCG